MATQTKRDKMSGSAESAVQPMTVWDDAGATLAESAAIAAAQAAAPASVLGVPQDANPSFNQESDSAWKVNISYRVRQPRKLTRMAQGEFRYNFDVPAKPKLVRWAPEIAVFSNQNFPTQHGVMTSNGLDVQPAGVLVSPPTANAGAEGIIAASSVTAAWAAAMRFLVGTTNATSIAGWAAGEVFISRVTVQQVDDDDTSIKVQWALGDNVTNGQRGEITGITHNAFDHVREWIGIETDRDGNTLVYKPTAVLINRPWPEGIHGLLQINPPTKP